MVSPVDLVSAPSSDNPYVHALTGTYTYRPGYQIIYALQGNPGDAATMGGALWAQQGAAQAFVLATQAWMAVANISISATPNAYDGSQSRSGYTWVEQLVDLGSDTGLLGEHSLPGPGSMIGQFNNAISLFTTANNAPGGYSFITFLHEIGHGLGLTHPHEDGNSFPGVDGSDDTGDNGLNQGIYTVMSYNDGYSAAMSTSDAWGWSETPMAFDIATIQNMYGANMSTATGDNVYMLPQANGSGTGWSCIWDAAGIDTISAGATATSCTIDLRSATLLDAPGGGGFVSEINGVVGGFTIAHGATVENATGGGGDDLIQGDDSANALNGNGGHDEIFGGGGDDRIEGSGALYGDDGNDVLIGDVIADMHGGTGNDQLFAGSGSSGLHGDDGNDILVGGAGNDTLYGDAGNDTFTGGGGNDTYYVDSASELVFEQPGGGHDWVFSTASEYLYAGIEDLTLQSSAMFGVGNELDNTIAGTNDTNLLLGGAGNDTLIGNGGNDQLFGESGDDVLHGDLGIDYLVGGTGNDVLVGGGSADALYGEDGNDTLYADGTNDDDGGASIPNHTPDFVTDILVGGNGNDVLHGDSGLGDYDLMDGGSGDDVYYVDTGDDLTFEAAGGGSDTVYANVAGANNGVYLYANVENLVLLGTTTFGVGNELDNHLTGNASANWLLGGAGNDVLNGKAGNDVLFGEGGADTFIFEHGTGGDVIGDFTPGTDKIDLSAFGITDYQTVVNAMHEVNGTTAIDLGGGDFIVLNGVANAALHQGDFILSGGTEAIVHSEQRTTVVPDDHHQDSAIRAELMHAFDAPHFVLKVDGSAFADQYL